MHRALVGARVTEAPGWRRSRRRGHESVETGDSRTRRESTPSLFGRQGVPGTSTRDILDGAGPSNPSAISYHFGSKAGLVDDLVTELIAEA